MDAHDTPCAQRLLHTLASHRGCQRPRHCRWQPRCRARSPDGISRSAGLCDGCVARSASAFGSPTLAAAYQYARRLVVWLRNVSGVLYAEAPAPFRITFITRGSLLFYLLTWYEAQ